MDKEKKESTKKSAKERKEEAKKKMKESKEKVVTFVKESPMKVIAVAVPVIALILTMLLYTSTERETYTVLYAGLDPTETTEIFSLLKLKGAEPKLNNNSEIMVVSSEFDVWLLQLASEGYPKSGSPNYSYYAENSGMTTTQAELQQWEHYQLQEDIATTIKRLNSVLDASVIINQANTSDYIWDKATNTATGSVAVMLTPQLNVEFSNEQVMSIKTLVAASVPKIEVEDVKIINSRTSLEMGVQTEEIGLTNTITALQNYELQAIVQKQLEDNIVRLLTPRYGIDGVVATVKATLNYDKMISESVELFEKPDGGGFLTSSAGQYGLDGNVSYGGIVGEENNTDIPVYQYGSIIDDNITYYAWNTKFDYSYIKSQVEAGYAELERATVSVLVDEANMTDARRNELTSLISMSADIPPELISVSSISTTYIEPEIIEPEEIIEVSIFDIIPWYVMLIVVLVIAFIVWIVLFIRTRKRRKELAAQKEAERILQEQREAAERELQEYKQSIATAANSEEHDKQEAIIDEIREFTSNNPEIATSLIKNWLKEEDV